MISSLAIHRNVPLALCEDVVRVGNSPELIVREMPKSAINGLPDKEMSILSCKGIVRQSQQTNRERKKAHCLKISVLYAL